ncbi:diguanylate cyclase [Geothermobacter hydrogeniphilus]|uniref:diguanylate cyclase n=1 Tax=Geothermobacter hydrogeniphilus TaxID=1969733 RepID=A0A1X0Y436_9BACT|nr:diguanylate cyclase [Geothermobacter hydrogeniphilus]ORJ59814.1 hypothetical protein B5V00_09060 [Geothermobacter hydrogeniphilus]
MADNILFTADPVELLDTLREFSFLQPYNLAVFSEREGLVAFRGEKNRMCGAFGENWLCLDGCDKNYKQEIDRAVSERKARIFNCSSGLLNFVLPFQDRDQHIHYLLAGGIRDQATDLEHLETIIRDRQINGIYFLEQWEQLPSTTRLAVKDVIDNIYGVLPLIGDNNYYARVYERTVDLINTISDLGPEIDRAETVDDVIQLLSETLTVLFNIPRIAILYPQGNKRQLILKGLLGLDNGAAIRLGAKSSGVLMQRKGERSLVLRGKQLKSLFPYLDAEHLSCLPLLVDNKLIGFLALFDHELSQRDLMIIELLCSRIAGKLLRLRRRRNREQESQRSRQLLDMVSRLAQLENSQHFHQGLVEMATDLLDAGKGSLMLLDDRREKLAIVASIGMNRQLARNMKLLKGQGIAGRVVITGSPMLVHDIEQDQRVSIDKRPRFATQSFLCLPFRSENEIIGVLNLSDKNNGSAFTVADLKTVEPLLEHAGSLVRRAGTLERASLLEELSSCDSLTGLHNRRFLDQRLDEELNRSSRQKLEFSVLLLDIDHFKNYNDHCGHLAGDKALKKLSHLLRRSAREMDSVTRFGGEEFCILLPETGREPARMVAERIRHGIEREPFYQEEVLPGGRLTISIGISCYPADGDSAEALLEAADRALYQAKDNGRNRIQLFEPTLRQQRIVFI